jgi:methylglutaconyl-CoA hydratase
MIPSGSISTVIENSVATITFSHPASNSFPSALLQQLTNELNTVDQNPDVAIIVLQSEGITTFCAGASFDELLSINTLEEGTKFFSGFANVINAMRNCSKLIIGRIQGKAVGGGVGSEIAVGIGPFVIEPVVSRKIGKMAFAEMTLNPTEWKSASWGKENRLFSEVFQSLDELDIRLNNFTSELSGYNQSALIEMKKVLWEGTENWDQLLYERAAISGKLALSEETKLALQKFKK